MKQLGQRNFELIIRGQKHVGPDPDDIFDYICEELYVGESNTIASFLKWVWNGGWSFASINYESVFQQFLRDTTDIGDGTRLLRAGVCEYDWARKGDES
jgi:hypothetical protein